MPVKDMYSLVEEARERFAEKGLDKDGSIKTTVGYGHIGDGEFSRGARPVSPSLPFPSVTKLT